MRKLSVWAPMLAAWAMVGSIQATAQTAPKPLTLGQSLKATLAGPAAGDCFALNVTAGQAVTVKLTSTAFAPKISVGRGAVCSGASFQYVKSGAAEAAVAFKAAPGRYMVLVQSGNGKLGPYSLASEGVAAVQVAGASTGPTRREIMDNQVNRRRSEVAAEEERKRLAELERQRREAESAAEFERWKAEQEAIAAAYQARQEEEDEEPPKPTVNLAEVFANSFNKAMDENAAEKAKQQAFLDDLARQQRAAQRAREERAELARQQAAERAEQSRQLAAVNEAQRQAAAQALAQRQREQQLEQNRRLEQQRVAQQQVIQQRQQQQQVAQQRSSPITAPRTPPAAGSAGRASVRDNPNQCVTRPAIKPGSCKGGLEISVINGCGQPVDVRLCLKRNGAWACIASWGVPSQGRASQQICQGAEDEGFMSARYSDDNKTPLATAP